MELSTTPATVTYTFSVPQVITSFDYLNPFDNSVKSSNLVFYTSSDGILYEEAVRYTADAISYNKQTISLPTPKLCKGFRYECLTTNRTSGNAFLMNSANLWGYSYSE